MDPDGISVDVTDSVVTLTGEVETWFEKETTVDFALQTEGVTVEEMAQWYCDHLGMKKVRHDPGKKLFLADHTGTVVLELYSNHDKPMIPLAERTSAELHLAFVVKDPDAAIAELKAAGATLEEQRPPDYAGDVLCFFRDPFGMPMQVLTRNVPLLDD